MEFYLVSLLPPSVPNSPIIIYNNDNNDRKKLKIRPSKKETCLASRPLPFLEAASSFFLIFLQMIKRDIIILTVSSRKYLKHVQGSHEKRVLFIPFFYNKCYVLYNVLSSMFNFFMWVWTVEKTMDFFNFKENDSHLENNEKPLLPLFF